MNITKIIVCVALPAIAVFFAAHFLHTRRGWVVTHRTYEGFPLILRRPINIDTADNRKNYPTLAMITHEFNKRLSDGLPESDYNRTLFDFDQEIVKSFDSPKRGIPVLVETFGGKRIYYFYVAADTDVAGIVSSIEHHYPNEKLTWEVHLNNNWRFLDKYAKDYF